MPSGSKVPKAPRKLHVRGLSEERSLTLVETVARLYPSTDARKVESNAAALAVEGELVPSFALYAAILCGYRLRLHKPDAVSVLGELQGWLTSPPRNMSPEMASILVAALGPSVRRVLNGSGWGVGLGQTVRHKRDWGADFKRTRIRIGGMLPVARPAWLACLLVEALLESWNPAAVDQADGRRTRLLAFATSLLGREVRSGDWAPEKQRHSGPEVRTLLNEIVDAFQADAGVGLRPGAGNLAAQGLPGQLVIPERLKVLLMGGEALARNALRKTSPAVWEHFEAVLGQRVTAPARAV